MPKNKKAASPEAGPKSPRLGYYRNRNHRLVSFVVEDLDLKRRIEEAAKADDRSVNNWIIKNILPKIKEEVDHQLDKKAGRKP